MIHILNSFGSSVIGTIDDAMISPNALDVRLGGVRKVQHALFTIDEEQKIHRPSVKVEPDSRGYYYLDPGIYEVMADTDVSVGDGEAGWLIARSTLNRNGVHITSGLYDSGFRGPLAGVMHVNMGPMVIKQGTRFAQFLMFKAEMIKRYDGDYGLTVDGKQKPMEQQLYGEKH